MISSELARLDAMQMGLWPRARRGDVQAVDRVLKTGEGRVDLLAQLPDAAEQVEQPETGVDEFLRKLRAREQEAIPQPPAHVIGVPANPDAS